MKIRKHFLPPRSARPKEAKTRDAGGARDWRRRAAGHHRPPDAKDHDDAVHAEPDPDPNNKGGYILNVAIADVAFYVRPGSRWIATR